MLDKIFRDKLGKIRNEIESWRPQIAIQAEHASYKKSLEDHLKTGLKDLGMNINPMFPFKYKHSNIVITNGINVLIIVKSNINDMEEFFKIIGEMTYHINKWNGDILLVICNIESNFSDFLINKFDKDIDFDGKKIFIKTR